VVSGRVLNGATGRPVPAFTVNVIHYEWFVPSGFLSSPFRSEDGSFRCFLDETGTFAIEVTSPGLAPLRTERLSAQAGERKDVGELRLGSGGVISGLVKDAQGRPVPYARIHFLSATMETNEEAPFTDLDGRYEVPAIAPGTYRVFAVSPRHPLGMVPDVRVEEGRSTRVDLALATAAPVTLVVLDESGRPLEGAEISYTFESIRPLTSNMIAYYEPPAWGGDTTDASGCLAKPCLPATEVVFTVEAEGFSRVTRAEKLTAGKPARIEFRLERGR
jgi:hypothetical protein